MKTISLKTSKRKLVLKRKFTKQLKATQPIDENESEEDASLEKRDFSDSNPDVLQRTEWRLLSPQFGCQIGCSINLFSKSW